MKENNVPVWNGEFGPVYASDVRGDSTPAKINTARYNVLKDQLDVYSKGDPSGDNTPIGWSIWLYKDIGFQGLTYVSPNSKWFDVFGDWFIKKKKLGLDRWSNDIDPKNDTPEKYSKALYPHTWTVKDYFARVARDMLLSQILQHEYADLFVGLSFEELDELATSFKFENVEQRGELNAILKAYK